MKRKFCSFKLLHVFLKFLGTFLSRKQILEITFHMKTNVLNLYSTHVTPINWSRCGFASDQDSHEGP